MEMRGDRHADLAREAADEIERLRALGPEDDWEARGAASAMQDEIKRLRAEQGGVAMAAEQHGRIDELRRTQAEIERLRADNRRLCGIVRSAPCPGGGYIGQPVDEYPSVEACLQAGVCGCELGAALDNP